MNKNIIKKALIIGILSLIPFLMTGCGEQILSFTETTLNTAVLNRIEANRKILDELYGSDFLSKETYDDYSKHLTDISIYYKDEATRISNKVKEGNTSALGGSFAAAINKYSFINGWEIYAAGHTSIPDDEGKDYSVITEYKDGKPSMAWCPNGIYQLTLTDYLGYVGILNNYENGGTDCDCYKTYTRNTCKPLELIGNKVGTDINERFECPVYVLNPNMITGDGAQSLDAIIAAVQGAITTDAKGKKHVDTSILDKYFTPAKDSSGNKINLLSGLDDFKLVITSRDQDLSGTIIKPGYDTVVSEHDVPCFTIKYIEFDSIAYEKLRELVGINSNQYVYSPDNGGKMYLLEYPVYKLDYMYNSDDTVTGTFSESGIGVNLYTKKIIKYEPIKSNSGQITGWSKNGTEVSELIDNYLTLDGATNGGMDGQSAFVVNGTCNVKVTFNLKTDRATAEMKCGRIILRDYLEATYAPEMVNGEKLVVFGRKIRIVFNKFNDKEYVVWDKDEPMAYYVDKDGKKLSDTNILKPTDFCTASSLLLEDKVERLTYKGETSIVEIPAKEVDEDKLKTISDLKEVRLAYSSPIKPTMLFPGQEIGKTDFTSDSSSKQRFYAIATTKGIFDSGLYNNWINTSNPDASLDWWNKYLADNNFSYKVLHQDVNDYLLGNYSYELSQSGVVILDLDTVAFIQEQMDRESDVERVEVIRTIFILLGWGIICYSLVLILAWIVDTNSDIGIDLLTKLTFGHWIAVKYPEDIPSYDTSDNKYVSASGLMLSVIILIAVGIILLNVNIFDLVIAIIKTFGKFASQVEKMIKGM